MPGRDGQEFPVNVISSVAGKSAILSKCVKSILDVDFYRGLWDAQAQS